MQETYTIVYWMRYIHGIKENPSVSFARITANVRFMQSWS